MKRIFYSLILCALTLLATERVSAQCAAGEIEVLIDLVTDQYGSETSWEVSDETSGTVFASGSGYADGSAVTVNESACVPEGTIVEVKVLDSFGDGIFSPGFFRVTVEGIVVFEATNFGSEGLTTLAVPLPQVDGQMVSITMGDKVAKGEHWIEGMVKNGGKTAISTLTIGWSVDGGVERYDYLTGLNIEPFTEVHWEHSLGWNANATGNQTITAWVQDVNASEDAVMSNNSISKTVEVFEKSRNALVEVVTSANCPPCAATIPPLVGRVSSSNSFTIFLAYHAGPGGYSDDPFYQNNMPLYNVMDSYYGVSGYPTATIDGKINDYDYPSNITEPVMYDRSLEASNFIIENGSFTQDGTEAQFSADITATVNADFSNYVVHAAIVETEVSFETPPGTNGETHFVNPVLAKVPMLGTDVTDVIDATTASGTFTSTYTIPSTVYDVANLAVVIFVQDNTTKEVHNALMIDQRGKADVSQPTSVITNAAQDFSLTAYPNPAEDQLNIEIDMIEEGKVSLDLVNAMGQIVKKVSSDYLTAGKQTVRFNTSDLTPGMYIVNMQTAENKSASLRVMVK